MLRASWKFVCKTPTALGLHLFFYYTFEKIMQFAL